MRAQGGSAGPREKVQEAAERRVHSDRGAETVLLVGEAWGKRTHPFMPPAEPSSSRDGRGSSRRETGHSDAPSGRLPWPFAGPTRASLPGTTSRFAPKGLIRKEASRTPDELSRGETRPGRLQERKRTCRPHWQESELSGKMTAT